MQTDNSLDPKRGNCRRNAIKTDQQRDRERGRDRKREKEGRKVVKVYERNETEGRCKSCGTKETSSLDLIIVNA